MPSIESLLNFCDFFHITPAEFFDETMQYPIESMKIIKELNRLTPEEHDLILELLKTINRNK